MKIQEDVEERQGDACAGSFTHTCLFIFSTQANYVISPDSKVERRFITAPNLLPGAVTSNTSDATSSDLPPYSASLTALWKATKSCLHLSQRLKQFFFFPWNTQQIIWKPDTAVCVCACAFNHFRIPWNAMQRYLVKGRADAVVKVFKFAKPTHADYYFF